MRVKKFQSTYNIDLHTIPKMGGGERLVERAGYIPAKIQIENIMRAGQNLTNYRKEMYDYANPQEDDEKYIDPTRRKNFDIVDAFELQESVNSRIIERQRERMEQQKTAGKSKKENKTIEAGVQGSNTAEIDTGKK